MKMVACFGAGVIVGCAYGFFYFDLLNPTERDIVRAMGLTGRRVLAAKFRRWFGSTLAEFPTRGHRVYVR
jgi:hypothetical protein